ncbi:MAG: hypothetical protein KKF98_02825 [Bacteroidetes bacterium]|nr:hypothetical protein [Bacteroidota bacterium]
MSKTDTSIEQRERNNRCGLGRKNKVSRDVEIKPSEKAALFLQGGVCLLLTNTLMGEKMLLATAS